MDFNESSIKLGCIQAMLTSLLENSDGQCASTVSALTTMQKTIMVPCSWLAAAAIRSVIISYVIIKKSF